MEDNGVTYLDKSRWNRGRRRRREGVGLTTEERWLKGLGQSLRQRRVIAGKTQEQLSREIGMSETTVYQYESGLASIPVVKLVRLCTALNVNADEVVLDTIGTIGEVIAVAMARTRELQ